MYHLMIVDDEKLVRKRILSAIPFEELGLTLCAEAENGIQALEEFEQHHPQIVIMDINIPFINGIDVAKQMIASGPSVNVLIVTGCATLDAAREALRSGMVDFLLKPVNFQELAASLKKIVSNIQTQTRQALERQRMERLLEHSMPMLRNRYFLSLMVCETYPAEEDCRRYLKDFGIDGPASDICAAILCPNYGRLSMNEQFPMQGVLEEEVLKALRTDQCGCLVLFDSMQRAVLLVYGTQNNLDFWLEEKLSILRDRMRYIYRLDFRASIGIPVDRFSHIRDSYHAAERALEHGSIFGDDSIINSSNAKSIAGDGPKLFTMYHAEILDVFSAQDHQHAKEVLDQFLNQIIASAGNSIQYLQQKSVEILSIMFSCAQELGVNCDSFYNLTPPIFTQVLLSANLGNLRKILHETAESLITQISGRQDQTSSRVVSSALQYIRQNYSDPDLNITRVAQHIDLSPGYLSQLFKKTTGASFADYLNQFRIEEAKKLLRSTHMRIYEVSEAVGYHNSKYFFQVFKQLTGNRPREFYQKSAGDAV